MTRGRTIALCLAFYVAGAASWALVGDQVAPPAPATTKAPEPTPSAAGKSMTIAKAHQFVMIDAKDLPVVTWKLDGGGDVLVEINDHGTVRRINLTKLSQSRWVN